MATESPVRMVEGRKWSSTKDAASYGSPLKSSIAAEELGLLLKGHRTPADQSESVPNRSGSAPPSMEGSFAAIGNLLAQQNLNMNPSLESLHNAIENCESEEQLRSDPAYLAYYCSNINLNPRLPPPLLSRENRRLVRHIGGLGNNWRSTSVDDSGNISLHLSGGSLSTHKEEPEDERSAKEESENSFDNSSVLISSHGAFAAARHKSLVDLIQEDFPRTPSPVYSHSRSSGHAADDAEQDTHAVTSNISSMSLSEAPEKSGGSDVDADADAYELEVHALKLSPGNDSQTSSFPRTPPKKRDDSGTNEAGQEGDSPIIGSIQSGIAAETRMRNRQEQQSYSRNAPQQHPSIHHTNPHQAHGVQALMVSQAMNHPHSAVNNISHGHPNFAPIDVHQPSLNSSTLYATPAAYMTAGSPFYPNFQPSGLYSAHYGAGGYALGSTFLPPFMTSYPSHGPIPMPYGAASAPGTDGRTTAPLTGESIAHIGGSHQPGKFYGPHGLMVQPPSLMDPLHMQYFQHPFGDAYGATVQHDHLASSGTSGAQFEAAFAQRRDLPAPAYLGDRNLQPPTYGNLSVPSPGKVGINGNSYYGGPGSMGVISQFPASPIPSPVLPSSPVGSVNHFARRSEGRYPQAANRNTGLYSGSQGSRGINSFDDHKRHYFLEELKSSNARKFELSDIVGHIVEFSVDQHGSRFIQQKLEHCSAEDKDSVFKEVLPHASKLMTDVFGNYVIQKFFEHGSSEQRKELADKLAGQVLELSLQMYGCRVIQKALEVIELDQKAQLVQELDGHVMRCVRDQNGNHVIQKCIECLPSDNIDFIISAFRSQVATLSTHPYGCRVIQRVLEHCSEGQQSQCIVDEILESAFHLAQDQYGNYVTQHVLERGNAYERSQIISKLNGKVIQMSQHKYASNVVEKCLEYGDVAERDLLIEEIIRRPEDNDGLLTMMKDQFANYVIQKILDIGSDRQKEVLLNHIKLHINALKKYTYGKHIVARYEQLCGEESQAPES